MNYRKHEKLTRPRLNEKMLVDALIKIVRSHRPPKSRTYVTLKPCPAE